MTSPVFTYHNQIQALYIAYYGRPADPGGLAYWVGRLEYGEDLGQAVNAFGVSDEFTERFGELDNATLINNIYQQIFNRDAEAQGLAFYVDLLESGAASLADISKRIVDGARGDDHTALAQKTTLANGFTESVETLERPYKGEAAIAAAAELLAAVNADAASLESQYQRIDSVVQRFVTDLEDYSSEPQDNSGDGYRYRREYDSDKDGIAESIVLEEYDAEGRLISRFYSHEDGDSHEAGDSQSQDYVYDDQGRLVEEGRGTETYYHSYNGQGQKISTGTDSDGDGQIDSLEEYSFNGQGEPTSIVRYLTGQETAVYRKTFQYDNDGNLIRTELDEDGDGALDQLLLAEFDEQGNQLLDWRDLDGNGNADHIKRSAFNEAGDQTLFELDSDGDGEIEYSITREYDAAGNRVYFGRDLDGDGQDEWGVRSTYDDKGNKTLESKDNDGDGVLDFISRYQYDADGQMIQQSDDENCDGQDDFVYYYQYDDQGRVLSYERDTHADGQIDLAKTYAYSDGRIVVSEKQDFSFDGIFSAISMTEYDLEWNILSRRYDGNDDGQWENVYLSEFNDQGLVVRYGQDADGDGLVDENSGESWLYNDNGDLLRHQRYEEGEGEIAYLKVQQYDTEGNLTFVGVSGFDADFEVTVASDGEVV